MKLIFSLLAIMLLNKDCDQKKTTDVSNDITENSENPTKMMQDETIISYVASTRGFYEKIWVRKDSLTVTMDREHKMTMRYQTPENDWNELMTLLKDVNIEEMPSLESPTKMRHYDGAAHANLSVGKGESEIRSESFDHGYPPKSIEAVVNKVLSMKKMHEKN